MNNPGEPELSVVVVVGPLRERAGPCLRSLLDQGLGPRMELILVDFDSDGGPVDGDDDPCVRRVVAPPGATFSSIRADVLLHRVSAPVVALIEEHVRVRPGWAEALLDAHRGPWAGVGSAVEPENPGVGRSDLHGLLSYGWFMAPQERREADLLPGHNASYKTAAVRRYGDELARLLVCDLVLQRRLHADGGRLLIEPASRIGHLNEASSRTLLRGMFLWNRCYGSLRAREEGWSPLRRVAYLFGWPLVPLWGLLLMLRRHRRQPARRALLLRHLPALAVLLWSGAVGQCWGMLFGVGDAERRFTDYELTAPRPTPEPAA